MEEIVHVRYTESLQNKVVLATMANSVNPDGYHFASHQKFLGIAATSTQITKYHS